MADRTGAVLLRGWLGLPHSVPFHYKGDEEGKRVPIENRKLSPGEAHSVEEAINDLVAQGRITREDKEKLDRGEFQIRVDPKDTGLTGDVTTPYASHFTLAAIHEKSLKAVVEPPRSSGTTSVHGPMPLVSTRKPGVDAISPAPTVSVAQAAAAAAKPKKPDEILTTTILAKTRRETERSPAKKSVGKAKPFAPFSLSVGDGRFADGRKTNRSNRSAEGDFIIKEGAIGEKLQLGFNGIDTVAEGQEKSFRTYAVITYPDGTTSEPIFASQKGNTKRTVDLTQSGKYHIDYFAAEIGSQGEQKLLDDSTLSVSLVEPKKIKS